MHADSELIQNKPGTVVSQKSSWQRRKKRDKGIRIARKRLFYILINSTAVYILSYLLSYLFYQLITMACSHLLGIHSVLYYYEIVFGVSNYSPEWTKAKIGFIYLIAPFLSLLSGSFLLFGLVKKYRLQRYHKMFLLWLGFHLMNFFFGGIIAGSLTGHGIGYAMDSVFWPMYFIYAILSLFGILCLVLLGNYFTEPFLKTNPSNYWSKRENRRQYLLFSLVSPWLIGSILMFLIKFPDHLPQHARITIHDSVLSLSMIFLILPMFYRKKNTRVHPESKSEGKNRNTLWLLVIATIVLVICFRVGLTGFFYSWFTKI
jgi:hypothetical protein